MSRIRADKLVSRTGTSAPELTYGVSIPVGYGITGAGGINISGIGTLGSLNIASTQVISSARQLQNIASLDSVTTATIESAVSNAPNTFTDLQVTGISTFVNGPVFIGATTSTGTVSQPLQVTGGAYVSGNLGIGTTNPTSRLHVIGDVLVAGIITATTFSGAVSGTATSTTNIPNLTGAIVSNNTTTSLGSFSSSNLATALIDKTGTGDNVFATSPTLVTPVLGAATGTSIVVGTGVTINASGIIASAGIITASQLSTGASGTGIGINTNTISGPSEIIIDPSPVGVGTTSGAVRIKGDLYVDGTQFIVNSTTIELADFNVGIATTVGTNALLDGAGIGIGSTSIRKTLTWSNGSTALKSSEDFDVASGKVYRVNGTSVLSNNTLGSGVVTSSLTSVGTLGQLQVTGVSTFTNGPILVGTTTSTGTASQRLQVTGGAYVSSNLGIGTTTPTSRLTVVGDVLVSGVTTSTDFNSASDINLKENIKPIINPIDKVLQINGVSFDWKDNGRSSMGVIAQEVERVLPELVSGVDSKTVNYNGLIGLLIEVVKEQQKEINNLKEKIK